MGEYYGGIEDDGESGVNVENVGLSTEYSETIACGPCGECVVALEKAVVIAAEASGLRVDAPTLVVSRAGGTNRVGCQGAVDGPAAPRKGPAAFADKALEASDSPPCAVVTKLGLGWEENCSACICSCMVWNCCGGTDVMGAIGRSASGVFCFKG